jgi:5'-phosphate synthase pdxT subunit
VASIGVVALQGGFAAHRQPLAALGHGYREVREARDLGGLDGLILPGGESTTQLKLLQRDGLCRELERWLAAGGPVLATCAGLVLLARRVEQPRQASLGWLDAVVRRNAYGRQIHSFEAVSRGGLPLVLIRAPALVEIGPRVEVLDRLDGQPVWVRQGSIFAATFHPELSGDLTVHRAVFGVAP